MNLFTTAAVLAVLALITGCASVDMAPQEESAKAKQFGVPEEGKAGVYVFRKDSPFGAMLKKDIWINDECVGESARGVFFYHKIKGDREHKIATESEFSPNNLVLETESGNNYFIEQYMKLGVFVAGADLRRVDEDKGVEEVSNLDMAVPGNCSK